MVTLRRRRRAADASPDRTPPSAEGGPANSDEHGRQPERVRWSWVVGCLLGGAALNGLAFLVEAVWSWQGVAPSVLVNLGTAVALAGVLVVLERRFIGHVARASERAAQVAAERVETRLQARTDQLAARLDELQHEVLQRARGRAKEQDAKIAAMRDEVSFQTIADAMTTANSLVAIDEGQIIVQASHDPDGLALAFSWAEDLEFSNHRSPGPHLDITGPGVDLEWRRGESAADVGDRLILELQRAGTWDGEAMLDWGLALHHLQQALEIAIASRRRDPWKWHLHGSLIELVSATWAITTGGVELFGRGLMLAGQDFPQRIHPNLAKFAPEEAEHARTWFPEPPPAVTPDEWNRVIERAKRTLPHAAVSPGAERTWVPWGMDPRHAAASAP